MKVLSGILLAWIHIKLSNSLPIEEAPGFTPWPIEKRGVIAEDIFSNAQFGAKFGVGDDTCRGHLPKPGCWNMMDATVDVSGSGKETQVSISDAKSYRNSLQIEPQRPRNARYHVYFTLLAYQVQQKERPTLC